jgi:hypothetical protein
VDSLKVLDPERPIREADVQRPPLDVRSTQKDREARIAEQREIGGGMQPPIFSARPAGNLAQQYLHRARMFRDAAMRLPDYWNGEHFWPKYPLLNARHGTIAKGVCSTFSREWEAARQRAKTTAFQCS